MEYTQEEIYQMLTKDAPTPDWTKPVNGVACGGNKCYLHSGVLHLTAEQAERYHNELLRSLNAIEQNTF